jgi:hypothetical protein
LRAPFVEGILSNAYLSTLNSQLSTLNSLR